LTERLLRLRIAARELHTASGLQAQHLKTWPVLAGRERLDLLGRPLCAIKQAEVAGDASHCNERSHVVEESQLVGGD
jgi:hypothetical protein